MEVLFGLGVVWLAGEFVQKRKAAQALQGPTNLVTDYVASIPGDDNKGPLINSKPIQVWLSPDTAMKDVQNYGLIVGDPEAWNGTPLDATEDSLLDPGNYRDYGWPMNIPPVQFSNYYNYP